MKKMILAMTLAVCLLPVTFAQSGATPDQNEPAVEQQDRAVAPAADPVPALKPHNKMKHDMSGIEMKPAKKAKKAKKDKKAKKAAKKKAKHNKKKHTQY